MGNTRKRKISIKCGRNKYQTIKGTKGGKAIASGGYGCVFSPALVCKGNKSRTPKTISKLMTKKHANEEYKLIQSVKQKVASIPNYKNYFLVYNSSVCAPAKLSKQDLSHFQKCSSLKKDKITKRNVNANLDNLMSINLPYGGLAVDDFIYNNGNFQKMLLVHHSLVSLLKHGILPLNRLHIYHCDIKDSNVLVDDIHHHARLIDWGLSVEYEYTKHAPFPDNLRNRPLQFNVPFSVIIFTDSFYTKYSDYLNRGGKIEEQELKVFVLDYLVFWNKERGSGHYKFINEIMYLLYSNQFSNVADSQKPRMIEVEITIPFIVNYITDVLIHFTKYHDNGSLNLREYLHSVYLKVVDIWGFVMIYYPMLEILTDAVIDDRQTEAISAVEHLRKLFYTYLYKPRHEPIVHDELFRDLHTFGEMIEKLANQHGGGSIVGFFKRRKKMTKHFHDPFLLSLTKNKDT